MFTSMFCFNLEILVDLSRHSPRKMTSLSNSTKQERFFRILSKSFGFINTCKNDITLNKKTPQFHKIT